MLGNQARPQGAEDVANKKGENKNMLKALLPSLTNLATRTIPLALVAALAVKVTAQNLVVNGSFEDTVNCGTPTQCTLLKAMNWYNPTLSTPDLYDADTVRQCGYIIQNDSVVYIPPKDGFRMVGGFFWDGPFGGLARDYFGSELSQPLSPNANYEVSLWYVRHRAFQAAVDHIGVWFGSDSLFERPYGPLSVNSRLKLRDPSSEYLTEGYEWTQLVDTLTALGGERWLAIGNFDPQDSLHGIVADPGAAYPNCYYFIDDMELRLLPNTAISEIGSPSARWISGDIQVHWDGVTGPMESELLDAAGKLVMRSTATMVDQQARLSMGTLSKGLYVLRLRCANKEAVVKFVKMEGE